MFVEVNDRPGMVSFRDGRPLSVFTIEARSDRLDAIDIVTNPENLSPRRGPERGRGSADPRPAVHPQTIRTDRGKPQRSRRGSAARSRPP